MHFANTPSRWQRMAMPFVASLSLLGFTFVNFLNQHSYPLLRLEVGGFYIGLITLTALLALIYSCQGLVGRALLEGLLIAAVLDLNFNSLWLTGMGGTAVGLFAWVKHQSVMRAGAIMGSAMLLTSLVGMNRSSGWIETARASQGAPDKGVPRSAIIHLILDEHGGIEGFRTNTPQSRRMKAEMRAFFQSRGFAVFDRAYSEHLYTANSIPTLLMFGGSVRQQPDPKHSVIVAQNAYFDTFASKSYRARIYQSGYLRFCSHAVVNACETYDFDSLGALLGSQISASDRASLILFKFLRLSEVIQKAEGFTVFLKERGSPPGFINPPLQAMAYTSPIASMRVMDQIAEDVKEARPGDIYFAHLLIPHYPWVTDRHCAIRPLRDWDHQIVRTPNDERERIYFDQVRCVLKMTDKLLRSLEKSPAGRNAVVIIHGDHGSRIANRLPSVENSNQTSDADLIAAYSTLFVVRSPYFPAQEIAAPAPISDLLKQLSESEFTKLPKPRSGTPMVWLADADWHPRKRVQMPASWWHPTIGSNSADH